MIRSVRVPLGCAVTVGALLSLVQLAWGAGATYNVLKCHDAYGAWAATEGEFRSNGGNYQEVPLCENGAWRLHGVRTSGGNANGLFSQWSIAAPGGTSIGAVAASVNLRRETGHRAQFGYWIGTSFHVLDGIDTPGSGFKPGQLWSGLNATAVGVRVTCPDPSCPRPDNAAHAYFRNLEIIVRDQQDPAITNLVGNLATGSGWLRGTQRLDASASDGGSGLRSLVATVNGTAIASGVPGCPGEISRPYSRSLVPCSGGVSIGGDYATGDTRLGFRNGANSLRVQAEDFAGNVALLERTVFVDNAKPAIAFANSLDSDDPELIRAPVDDSHSGVAAARLYLRPADGSEWQPLETTIANGEVRSRVDSSAMPAGLYEFRAEATDAAGNSAATTQRADGSPMRLTFPLRAGVELRARLKHGAARRQTVPYGSRAAAAGRLLDAGGEPLPGAEITITEHFGQGALIRERVSQVTTDRKGRFSSKVPAGPSRSVDANFAGTRRYQPAGVGVGSLTVKSRASFRTSQRSVSEGGMVTFNGKVGHRGARIPAGGKLIELQVRLGRRWDTVREAFRTKPSGRYAFRYRFGTHYVDDARFRFRVKVHGEADWPFRRSISKHRTVVVRAR